MAVVFGIDFPVLEMLLILNVIMLIYIVISMFEIRSLIQLRRDLEELIGKPVKNKETKPNPEARQEERKN